MTEPRFRIKAVEKGWPVRWLAFSPRRAVVLVSNAAQAYCASRASIDAIMRQRGGVFGPCDLEVDPVDAPAPAYRAWSYVYVAGRTRRMYLALDRWGRVFATPYEFEAQVALREELSDLARKLWPGDIDTLVFEEAR